MRLSAVLLLAVSAAPVRAQSTIDWSPCADQGAGPPVSGRATECASLDMPLDHDDPDGPTMAIGIRRLLASGDGGHDGGAIGSPADAPVGTAGAGRELWYLAGGPGDAVGGALGRLADLLDDPTLDLYGIDHRGTGASGKLECPAEAAADSPDGAEITDEEWPACITYLEETRADLAFLTVTQAAMDLGRAIERVHSVDRIASADRVASVAGAGSVARRVASGAANAPRVFIFGASYGSFWANRYLQLFPDQPSGVILDGIVPADWSFAEFDARLDATGRAWLARCGRDEICARHLGTAPAKTAADVLARLDDGHCPTLGIDGSTARLSLGAVLMVDDIPNAIIPVLIHRWDRCAWHDDMALLHFYRHVIGAVGEPATHSPVLQRHVALSELWNATDPSAEDLEAALAATVMTTDVSASFARTYPAWPRYAPDSLDNHQAPFAGPMLMLQGGLDPTMGVDRLEALRRTYSGDFQTFVVIPEAGHVTLNFSECARSLYGQFLAHPRRAPDVSCAGTERFVDFAVDADTSAAILGTTDLWGDSVSPLATAWFYFRYRWLPIVLGVFGAIALFRASRRRRAEGRRPTGRLRPALAFLAWLLISFGCYVLAASTPLLLDYRGLAATATAAALAVLQSAAGMGVLWASRPREKLPTLP